MINFQIECTDTNSKARTGCLTTDHGVIHTPVFMPVGTQATVKGIHQHELKATIKAQIILANTYHLYLRPGVEIIHMAGGLHQFMNWDKPILTDSGGYQVYSLSKIRKITKKDVIFDSHIDGSKHILSPEKVVLLQRKIGADIIMAFDECTAYPCSHEEARESMVLTHHWLDRSLDSFREIKEKYSYSQTLVPIVQGGIYADLRIQSAEYISEKKMEINAIGGLSVGEPTELMYEMTEKVCSVLPKDKPRYLMGVGNPENILESISLGVDMFDCVLPTRNARHGLLYTSQGTINIKNEKWKSDFSPIDEKSSTPLSREHSKAYLRHLFAAKELLGPQIASLHNLGFYQWLVSEARKKIELRQFSKWKSEIVKSLLKRI